MRENKIKQMYYMEPSLVDEMENLLPEANAISKADFIRQAIKFYMAYLRQGKGLNFISPLLAQTIKSEIESVEQNISKMLFKVAVEQGKISILLADQYQKSDEFLKWVHEECANKVAETNGIISLEDAYDYQQGE